MVMSAKSRLKRAGQDAFSSVVRGLKLDRNWVARREVNGAIILMYHAVIDEENRGWICPEGSIEKRVFERQIRFIAKRRKAISMSDLTAMLQAGRTPPAKTVVVTFDDGYLDTLRVAGPILRRYGVPATVFAVSDWVGHASAPWVDRLYTSVVRRRRNTLRFGREAFHLTGNRAAGRAFRTIAARFVSTRSERRDELLADVVDQLRPDEEPPRLLMNWGELASWQALGPGYEVGAHTRSHANLTLLDADEIADEVTTCAEALEDRLGVTAPHFAYPYGRSSEIAERIVRQAGCQSAIATDPVSRAEAEVGPFGLSRVDAACGFSRMAFVTSGAYPELQQALLGQS